MPFKPINQRNFVVGALLRLVVAIALFIAFVLWLDAELEGCSPGGCGAGMGSVILLFLLMPAIYAVLITDVTIKRARDAGWNPLVGLVPLVIPIGTALAIPTGMLLPFWFLGTLAVGFILCIFGMVRSFGSSVFGVVDQ